MYSDGTTDNDHNDTSYALIHSSYTQVSKCDAICCFISRTCVSSKCIFSRGRDLVVGENETWWTTWWWWWWRQQQRSGTRQQQGLIVYKGEGADGRGGKDRQKYDVIKGERQTDRQRIQCPDYIK